MVNPLLLYELSHAIAEERRAEATRAHRGLINRGDAASRSARGLRRRARRRVAIGAALGRS
jgi:hypothetical protein